MNLRRIMLIGWIALSVAVTPAASAWAFVQSMTAGSGHEAGAPHAIADADTAGDIADMSDCHRAMKSSGDCLCCDAKAKCLSDAACMTKCCKVIGAAFSPERLTLHPIVHGRPVEPKKLPQWVSKLLSPPLT